MLSKKYFFSVNLMFLSINMYAAKYNNLAFFPVNVRYESVVQLICNNYSFFSALLRKCI